jgi:hypothetical protein
MLNSAKVHPHFSKHFIALYQASILVFKDGCSFIVHDKHKGEIVYARTATKENDENGWTEGFQLQAISDLLESDEVCRYYFSRVSVLVSTDAYFIVPDVISDEERIYELFKTDRKDLSNVLLFRNSIKGFDCELAFLVSENLHGLIQRFHPQAVFTHLMSHILESASKLPWQEKKFQYLIYWETNRYYYLLLEDGRLILADHQSFASTQEAVYFILNLYKQQLLSHEQSNIQMYGDILTRKEIHHLLKQYLGDVKWMSYFSKDQEAIQSYNLPSQAYFYFSILRSCE